jgi:prepilin-type N-terminal cleavage/methylation domain-containing protein
MKLSSSRIAWVRAFSLVEMMISLAVGGMILGVMVLGFSSFQQVFAATDDYYKATSDQMRVLDFIAQDMRRAISGSVSNNTKTLTLTLPDYLDESQNPPIPRTGTISASGTVTYGTAGNQPTAVYTIVGTSPNQTITRTYTPSSGSVTTTTLTVAAADYQFSCIDPNNPGSTANFLFGGTSQPTSVTARITFKPKFNRFSLGSARTATTVSATMLLRNHL